MKHIKTNLLTPKASVLDLPLFLLCHWLGFLKHHRETMWYRKSRGEQGGENILIEYLFCPRHCSRYFPCEWLMIMMILGKVSRISNYSFWAIKIITKKTLPKALKKKILHSTWNGSMCLWKSHTNMDRLNLLYKIGC